jgi:16S rRNA (adenine1518-N6/adenine1519-N6)-dimethyltransferase
VESAVVRIEPRIDPVVAPDEEEDFRAFVQGAFGFRRKQMGRVLRSLRDLSPEGAAATLTAAGIEPSARPETLAPTDFAVLMRALPSR